MAKTWTISSRKVVLPHGVEAATLHVADGKIAAIVPGRTMEADVGECVILPGLVDPHVHINEPGRAEWEGFETATKAAAAGGITTLVDMPLNSTPVTTTAAALKAKRVATKNKLWVDCGFYAGVLPTNIDHLHDLATAGVRGFKAFLVPSGIDDFPAVDEAVLREALPIIARTGLPFLVHAEQTCTGDRPVARTKNYNRYLSSRPDEWECAAIEMMIRLAREFRTPVHIVHLSSAKALPMLKQARAEGLPITVETCPHYLCFAAEDIPDGRTDFKCAPPIRSRANREQLWGALAEGIIDFIATDHSPCPPAMKYLEEGDFSRAWGGIASLGLALSVVWTEARQRGFLLTDVIRWLGGRPAEFLGLSGIKGEIRVGADADLVVFDPEATFGIDPETIAFRHKVTPYLGRRLRGRVERTFLHGKLVFDRGRWCDKSTGRLV